MKRIFKRFLIQSPRGRTLSSSSERLCDDGEGNVHVVHSQNVGYCPGCRRPIADLNELRGRCDYCRRGGLCDQCGEVRCRACGRRLCSSCRRGFPGQSTITACPTCFVRLQQRQAFTDAMLLQREAMLHRRQLFQELLAREQHAFQRRLLLQQVADRRRQHATQLRLQQQREAHLRRHHAAQFRLQLVREAHAQQRQHNQSATRWQALRLRAIQQRIMRQLAVIKEMSRLRRNKKHGMRWRIR